MTKCSTNSWNGKLFTSKSDASHLARFCITTFKFLLHSFVVYLWNVRKERWDGETTVRIVGQAGNPPQTRKYLPQLPVNLLNLSVHLWKRVDTRQTCARETKSRYMTNKAFISQKFHQDKTSHSHTPPSIPKLVLPTVTQTSPSLLTTWRTFVYNLSAWALTITFKMYQNVSNLFTCTPDFVPHRQTKVKMHIDIYVHTRTTI